MASLDFLTKLYKTSKSAVVIINTENTICWCSNLSKIGVYEEDIRGEKSKDYFGKNICELYPGEYIAKINGNCYTYNVKTFADRTNEFVVVEIRTVTLGASVVEDEAVCDLLSENQAIIRNSTCNIMATVDCLQAQKSRVSKSDYNSIVQWSKNIINSNRPLFNIIETRHECESELEEISLSTLTKSIADNCKKALSPKKIEVVINCTEDIISKMGELSYESLCLSAINKLMCICDGFVDKLIIGLEMLSEDSAELYFSTESPSGKVRITDAEELKKQIQRKDIMGTDLFYIKYFCEMFSAEATQKIERDIHKATVSIILPKCHSNGIMLFKCSRFLPENPFSRASMCIEKIASYIDDDTKR